LFAFLFKVGTRCLITAAGSYFIIFCFILRDAIGSILFIFSLIRFGPEKCALTADPFVGICRVLSVFPTNTGYIIKP